MPSPFGTKITGLNAFSAFATTDLLVGVDVSDTSMAPTGTDKNLTLSQLFGLATGDVTYSGFAGTIAAGAVTEAKMTLADVVIGNVSTAQHGFTPKLPNDATKFLNGTGAYSVPPGTGGAITFTYSQVAKVTVTATGSTTLVNTTGASGSVSLGANYFSAVGQALRITLGGYITTGASATNLYLFAKLGSGTVATTYTGPTNTSRTNVPIWGRLDIVCKAVGVSGLLDSAGFLYGANAVGQAFGYLAFANGTTAGTQAPTTQVSLDTTQAYTFDLQLNLSATGNTFVLTNLTLERIG